MIQRKKARAAVKPAQEGGFSGQGMAEVFCFAGEVGENVLGNVVRLIGRTHLAHGGSINHVRMAAHNLAEGGFVPVFRVVAQQLGVGLFLHLTY